jgi:L-aspartate oxidase
MQKMNQSHGYSKHHSYDLVILGSGAAGLNLALQSKGLRVALITKTDSIKSGSTPWAQGGIALPLGKEDSPALHFSDTIKAGGPLCNREMVDFLTRNAVSIMDDLEQIQMPLDRNSDGSLALNREGSHSVARIIRSRGDRTGEALADSLIQAVRQKENIEIFTSMLAISVIAEKNTASGVVCIDREDHAHIFHASAVVIATGGGGQLFSRTTNPVECTGDGYALAIQAGARCEHMEMIQFHPTALNAQKVEGRAALISEAVRGKGALLVDSYGRRIMEGVDPAMELASRDIVSRRIWEYVSRGEEVFLDARHIENFTATFEQVGEYCKQQGIDPEQDLIPVKPAAHYFMGGVAVDEKMRTSIKGLYAVGEASWTGIHGGNRLASNSLLECLVFSKAMAGEIRTNPGVKEEPFLFHSRRLSNGTLEFFRKQIQDLMFQGMGIVRTEEKMQDGLRSLETLQFRSYQAEDKGSIWNWIQLSHMFLAAREIVKQGLANRESQGAHFLKVNAEIQMA